MFIKNLMNRSAGLKGPWRRNFLDSVIENFECKRIDVHQIENALDGSLAPPVACSFSKANSNILAIADEDGGLLIVDTSLVGPDAIKQDWSAHSNAIFDLDWMPGEEKLVTAGGDQVVALWDVKKEEKIVSFVGHTSSVKSVAFCSRNKDLLVSGSRDGHIMLWDQRINKQTNGMMKCMRDIPEAHLAQSGKKTARKGKPEAKTSQHGVTAVIFQDEYTFASAGCVDGSIKLWDMRKLRDKRGGMLPKYTFACQSKEGGRRGISSLAFNNAESFLFANCRDGSVYQYDCINYKNTPVSCYRGHEVNSFFVKLSISPDDAYVMSGSSDSCAYVWPVTGSDYHRSSSTFGKTSSSSNHVKLVGHSAEVSSVAWCPDDVTRLVTLSDDNTMCIWRVDRRDPWDRPEEENALYKSVGRAEKCVVVETAPSPQKKCFFASPVKNTPRTSSNTVLKSLSNLPSRMKMHSSTIPAFFNKSALKKASQVTSPRKLIISPRKGIIPMSDSTLSEAAPSNPRNVKRKLCVDDDAENQGGNGRSAKLMKMTLDGDVTTAMLRYDDEVNENNLSLRNGSQIKTFNSSNPSKSVLSENNNRSISNEASCPEENSSPIILEGDTPHLDRAKSFHLNVLSEEQSTSACYSSPTANLPDFVKARHLKKIAQNLDSVHSTPVNDGGCRSVTEPMSPATSVADDCVTPRRTPRGGGGGNWLTQLSLKKAQDRTEMLKVQTPSPKRVKSSSVKTRSSASKKKNAR